ncbi:REST corepressor 3 [Trichonephila inaurata madagascariensis]|uniref:REST corepressor 3 n=1 Tax=Trichonephila inaurata madagascariensis TaxID=2747483 RepID=A0A8X7CRS1_9ARAC|nr:REST corepressor 3 [Trichonephila inaurata madagascariensis]
MPYRRKHRRGKVAEVSGSSGSEEISSSKMFKDSIKVGPEHQADIPNLIPEELCPKSENEKATLVWAPCSTIDDKILVDYVNETEKLGYTQEQSLGVLFWNANDLEKTRADISVYGPIPDFWSKEDKALFEEGIKIYGKNFSMIRRMLPDKPMKSVIEYYYSWKKTRHYTSVLDEREQLADGRRTEMLCSSDTINRSARKRKLPQDMYLNSDDLVATVSSANNEKNAFLRNVDLEIISLKRQIQNNKQDMSYLKQKACEGIDSYRPTEDEEQISDSWSSDEYLLAVQGIRRYGTDFKAIAEVIKVKNEEHVRNFYLNFREHLHRDKVLQEFLVTHGIAVKTEERINIFGDIPEFVRPCQSVRKQVEHRSSYVDKEDAEDGISDARAHGSMQEGRMAQRQHQLDLLEATDTAEGPTYGPGIDDTM